MLNDALLTSNTYQRENKKKGEHSFYKKRRVEEVGGYIVFVFREKSERA